MYLERVSFCAVKGKGAIEGKNGRDDEEGRRGFDEDNPNGFRPPVRSIAENSFPPD